MASSSSACLRLALRLCSSIRSRQKTRAFAAASVCGETAKKTAAAAAASAAALSTTTPASNPSAAANTASSPKGRAAGSSNDADDNRPLAFVFVGAPGVGKGTYSTRIADALGAEHISTGDLVRAEVKKGSELGKQVAAAVDRGDLVPDSLVTDLVKARLMASPSSSSASEPRSSKSRRAFVLDGFPRTASQASTLLDSIARVPLALNLTLREQVLVDKCLGRRVCGKCGKGYNVADIMLPACESTGEPAVVMPPMAPPRGCEAHMEVRSDDNPTTVRHRLSVYRREAAPLEAVFRDAGVLVDFAVTGGVRETLPMLMELFKGHGDGDGGIKEESSTSKDNSGSSSSDEGQRAA